MLGTGCKQNNKLIPLSRFYSHENDEIWIFPIVATAIVTKNEALLWTNARYWMQADQQIDSLI